MKYSPYRIETPTEFPLKYESLYPGISISGIISDISIRDYAIRTEEKRKREAKICIWNQDENGNWNTGCGEIFVFIEGTPKENKMRFCPYCGEHVKEATTTSHPEYRTSPNRAKEKKYYE